MNAPWRLLALSVLLAITAGAQPPTQNTLPKKPKGRGCTVGVITDFDVYMLKLVNQTRLDHGAPTLRFDDKLIASATHHNDWMLQNINKIKSHQTPDSFSHYETLSGAPSGAPATKSRCFTGVTVGERALAAGLMFTHAGENISVLLSSEPIPITVKLIEHYFRGFMNSPGHKAQTLSRNFSLFGCATRTRKVIWRDGNAQPPLRFANYLTQNFADSETYHVFGVLYRDRDGDGKWTPRRSDDRRHEGLEDIAFQVRKAGTDTVVAEGLTHETGLFSARIGLGFYDIVFEIAAAGGGSFTFPGVEAWEENVDTGEHVASLTRD